VPGDPKECKMHAANCRTLAAQATSPAAKETFTNLAETWERLAAELESAQTFLKAMAAIDPKNLPILPRSWLIESPRRRLRDAASCSA
jgi:hypothetical protein